MMSLSLNIVGNIWNDVRAQDKYKDNIISRLLNPTMLQVSVEIQWLQCTIQQLSAIIQ